MGGLKRRRGKGQGPLPRGSGVVPPIFSFSPPSFAEGSLGFRVPLVAGLQEGATRPLICFSGGTSPRPPARGLCPLHPLIFPPHPRGLRVCQGSGAPSWPGCRSCFLVPLIDFSGWTPPRPPGRGFYPLHPLEKGVQGTPSPCRGEVGGVPPRTQQWGRGGTS